MTTSLFTLTAAYKVVSITILANQSKIEILIAMISAV